MAIQIGPEVGWIEECFRQSPLEEMRPGELTWATVGAELEHEDADCDDITKAEIKEASPYIRLGSKPHSTPLTLKWLEENYELAEGVCIPRSALYVHYLDFCGHNDTNPVNAASFGKIIRQQFPQITTRRLGTRGQSKYHYYGVAIRESSRYYDVMYSKNGVQAVKTEGRDCGKQVIMYSPRSKLGTLLPEFPDIKDIRLPANIAEDKVVTFLMMYRTHCQRILDTVIRANFDEVQNFLLHFWQGMPQHILPILGCRVIVTLVGVCDSILYKAIAQVLMPSVLQALPESLTQVIRKFAKHMDEWLRIAMNSLPENLRKVKFDLARRFAHLLRRQTSLNHLCQATRSVTHSSDIMNQMLDDWTCIDLSSICKQTLYTMDKYSDYDQEVIVKLYHEFESLLHDQAPIEAYVEWLNSMVNRCVVQTSTNKPGSIRKTARQFLLMWSCFGTRVIRDMTLHSAPSFGSFHLLHLTFDDYVLYLVESLHTQERYNELLNSLIGYTDTCEILDEIQSASLTTLTTSTTPAMTSPTTTSSSDYDGSESSPEQCRRPSVITGTGGAEYMKTYNHHTENESFSLNSAGSRSYDLQCGSQSGSSSMSPTSSDYAATYQSYMTTPAPSGYESECYAPPMGGGRYYHAPTDDKEQWNTGRYHHGAGQSGAGNQFNVAAQQSMTPSGGYHQSYDYSANAAYPAVDYHHNHNHHNHHHQYPTQQSDDGGAALMYMNGCSRFNGYYQNQQNSSMPDTSKYCGGKRKSEDHVPLPASEQKKRLCSDGMASFDDVISSDS